MELLVISLILIALIVLFVWISVRVFVKALRAPKEAMKKLNNLNDLRGMSYAELCKQLGKPTSVSMGSDRQKEVYWRISNGFASWHAFSKDTSIYALFDQNGICIDYSYESNRNT